MLSGGDRLLGLQSQVMHSLRKELDSADFIIVGNQREDGPRLNIDRYVEVPRVVREAGWLRQKFRGVFGTFFPQWYGEEQRNLFAALYASMDFRPVESNGGTTVFVRQGGDGSIMIAGKIYDVASFTSMVMNDHQWTPGSVLRRMLYIGEKPFGTERFVAHSKFVGKEYPSYTVTIEALNEEKPDFQNFVDTFASRSEREIEELVYPLKDSSIFYSLDRLFTHAGSMNVSDIRNLVRSRAGSDTLKNLPGILRMGVGLRLAADGRAKAIVLRFHQGDRGEGKDEARLDNESLWVGRIHQNDSRTIVWEISNSNPEFDLHRNQDSLNDLTSIVKSIFASGLKHICIPKSVYEEILVKKNDNGNSTPGTQGRTPVDRHGEGEIPPVTFDSPAQSRRVAEGAVGGGMGVFSPVIPVSTMVAPGFSLGSGMVFGLMPALV